LTHETKYASGTMKFVDLLALRGSSDPQDSPSYGPGPMLSQDVNLSVRLSHSHAGILSKRQNISSNILHHRVATPF